MARVKMAPSIYIALYVMMVHSQLFSQAETQTPQMARTELKIARSLEPENTQKVNVMTNDGQITQLIVKKRDGKSNNIPSSTLVQSHNKGNEINIESKAHDSVSNSSVQQNAFYTSKSTGNWAPMPIPSISDLGNANGELQSRAYSPQFNLVPSYSQQISERIEPTVYITSASYNHPQRRSEMNEIIQSYIDRINADETRSLKNDRNPVNIEVTSTKVPDIKVPEPVNVISVPMYVKGQTEYKKGRSIIKIDSDGIPVVHGVRMPDDESDRQTWRNARVINGELVPYENGYVPKPAEPFGYGQPVYAKKEEPKSVGPFMTADNFEPPKSVGPFTKNDNLNPSSAESFKNQGYTRFTHTEGGYGPFTKTDNSRVANSKLIEYIKEINAQESKRDYFSGRASRSDTAEFSDNNPSHQMQRRMLQHQGNTVYPTSLLYSFPSTKLSPVVFNEGVRNPVLQYAHPELGVQPAKVSPPETTAEKADDREKTLEYFSKDIHSDRSPYAVEPATSTDDRYYEPSTDKRSNDNQRKFNYYSDSNDYQNKFNYYNKDSGKYPYNYGYIKRVQQPFWIKLTESMKDSFQNGFATVRQYTKPVFDPIVQATRPVIDPIVEATQKISHNLGFTRMHQAQDKVGVVGPVAGGVILPALGLVAGGAALGLGAAAVGRYLDVDMMRSTAEDEDDDDLEHKRALEAINKRPDEQYYVLMATNADDSKRYKREISQLNIYDENYNLNNNLNRQKRTDAKNIHDESRNDKFDHYADVIEVYNMPENQQLSSIDQLIEIAENNGNQNSNNNHNVDKRSIDPDVTEDQYFGGLIQNVEQQFSGDLAGSFDQQIRSTDWSNTPCAKRTFCDIMEQQSGDHVALMEKKMDTFLSMIHPAIGSGLSLHLQDVMEAIRRHECAKFVCRR